jgi:2-iminobutanoate/2-iminopropanoate deaminase
VDFNEALKGAQAMIRDGRNSGALPTAGGPFSQLVKVDNLLFLSGQVAQDHNTGKLIEGDVGAQVTQIFSNIGAVLGAAGCDVSHVVKVNVYLTDMHDYAAMNEAYSACFSAPYPARTAIAVVALPLGARIEIEVVAQVG